MVINTQYLYPEGQFSSKDVYPLPWGNAAHLPSTLPETRLKSVGYTLAVGHYTPWTRAELRVPGVIPYHQEVTWCNGSGNPVQWGLWLVWQEITSVGRFSLILENHRFSDFLGHVWEPPWFLLFKKIGSLWEQSRVSDFFCKEKIPVLKLGSSQQFKNSQFSWLVLTSRISEISIFFFKNYYFIYYYFIFWDKK